MSKKEKNKLNVNKLNRLNEEDETQAISDSEINSSDLSSKNKTNQDGDATGQEAAAVEAAGLAATRAAKLFPILPYCNLNLIMDARKRLEHLEQLLIDRLVLNDESNRSGTQQGMTTAVSNEFASASTALFSSYLSPIGSIETNVKEKQASKEARDSLLDLNNLCLNDECMKNFKILNLISMKTLEERSENSDSDDQLSKSPRASGTEGSDGETEKKEKRSFDLSNHEEYLRLVENSKKVQQVNLSRNSLRFIPLNLLEVFVNLQYIDLSENSFEQIGLISFIKFNSLKEINLSTNFLTSFKAVIEDAELKRMNEHHPTSESEESEESATSQLSQNLFNNLERLNLANNKLKCSNCLIISQFRNLKYLNLSNNNFQISTAPVNPTTANMNQVMLAQQPPVDAILFPWQRSATQMKSLIELNLSKNNKPMSSTNSFVSANTSGTNAQTTQTRTEVRISSSLSQATQMNRLSGIRPRTFNNLTNLRILNLSENNLYNVPSDIKDLKFLEELYLDHNNLEFIPSELSDLRMLKVLSLNDNKLVEVTENFCSYSRFKMGIEKLFLSKNQLKNQTLSNRLVLFESLKHLDLSENQFDQVPNALPIYLEVLNMNKNKIKTLMIRPLPIEARQDEEMMSALKLVTTRVYEDPLIFGNEARQNEESIYDQPDVDQQEELVMPHVFYLRNLKRLEISDNYLQDIPSDFGILNSNLEYLDLSNNLLTQVSMSLCRGLANLKRLNLASNKIRELPDKIREMSDLESLDLSKNRLSSLNFELCNELKNLKELNLSSNYLEELPLYSSNRRSRASRSNPGSAKKKSSQAKMTNSSVGSISIAAQKATTAKNSAFEEPKPSLTPSSGSKPKNRFTFALSNLKKIDLSSNRFKSGLSLYTAFALSTNLEEVNLSSNRIVSIEVENLNEIALLAELAHEQNQQLPNEEHVQNLNSKYKLNRLRSLNLSNNQITFTRGGFTRLLCNLYKLAPNLKAFYYDQTNGSKLGVFDLQPKESIAPAATSSDMHKNSSPIKGKDSSPIQLPSVVQLNEDYYFELDENDPSDAGASRGTVDGLSNLESARSEANNQHHDNTKALKHKNQLYEMLLERLEILDLSNNGLKKLPGLIYRFKNLREIHLNGNLLKKIPHEMYEIKSPVQEEVIEKKPAAKAAAPKDENDENEFLDEELEKPKKKKGKKKKQKEEPVQPEIKVVPVVKEELPPQKPLSETIEILSLNDNQIESVPDTLFSNFKRLKEIKLLNNPLKDPPQESVCISAKFTRTDRIRSSSAFKLKARNKDLNEDTSKPISGGHMEESTVITLLDKSGQSKPAASALSAPKLKVNAFDIKKMNEELIDSQLSNELNLPNLFYETNENLKALQSYMLKFKKREDMMLCNMFMVIKDNIDSLDTLLKLMRRLRMPMDKVQLACKDIAENITKNWSKIAAVEFAPKPGELSLSRKELTRKMHQYILKIQAWNMLNFWRNTFGTDAQSDEIIRIFKLMNSNQYENALYEKLLSLKYNSSLFKV